MSQVRSINGRRVTGVKALPILALVFLGLGIAGIAAAAVSYGVESRSARSAVASGKIVDTGYRPLVQFKTAQGTIIQFLSPVRSSFLKTGDAVSVAYNPDDARDAAIDGVVGRWLLAALFGGLGGVFAVIGAGLGLAWRILRRRMPVP